VGLCWMDGHAWPVSKWMGGILWRSAVGLVVQVGGEQMEYGGARDRGQQVDGQQVYDGGQQVDVDCGACDGVSRYRWVCL
jgi:hypothetical protein